MIKKIIAVMLCIICLSGAFEFPVSAASYPEIKTTLVDNSEQLGSKKTFDVWARNSANEKITAVVKFNGERITPTWDDSEKSSYTLLFTKEGENIVTVSASSDGGRKKELTYHINYRKANPGEEIGKAVWSVELFTIGCGFLVYPVEAPIYEGETAAEQLIRLLNDSGYVGYYNGTPKSSFYLGYIADGTSTAEKYENYSKSAAPKNPKNLDISPDIPDLLTPYLEETSTYFDPDDYNNSKGYLGEFVFTNGSGWMYSVNGSFPNVGFADEYLSDGDVVRVQFTLAYGADIGGLGALGGVQAGTENQPASGFYTVANKDELCRSLCRARSTGKNVQQALSVMSTLNALQADVDNAVKLLNNATPTPSTNSSSSASSSSSSTVASSSSSSSKSSSVSSSSSKSSSVSSSSSKSSSVSSSSSKSSSVSSSSSKSSSVSSSSSKSSSMSSSSSKSSSVSSSSSKSSSVSSSSSKSSSVSSSSSISSSASSSSVASSSSSSAMSSNSGSSTVSSSTTMSSTTSGSTSSTVSGTESLSENENNDGFPVVFVVIGAGVAVIAAVIIVVIRKIRK